jgi:o-succinylbenzoate synthase
VDTAPDADVAGDGAPDGTGADVADRAEPPLRHRWDALGTGAALALDGAELVRVDLGLRAPVGTSAGTHRTRPLLFVRLRCRVPATGRTVDGWGECAALGDTTYDAEDLDDAWDTLGGVLLPGLAGAARSLGGLLVSLGGLHRLAGLAPGHPLAFAAVEAAVADAHLRAAGTSFAGLLGVVGAEVAPGAVVGTAASPDAVVAAVAARAADGYARVKVKIAPGADVDVVAALVAWSASAPDPVPGLQVDANGAYGPDDLDRLAALDRFGLLCIEQPFGRDDLASHRALAARIATPLCLDESLHDPGSVRDAVETGACSVVCVKPARLGGIGSALDVVSWCTTARVPWWIGGMFESGVGRAVTTALAAVPGASLPGDLAPSDTYLADDVVAPAATRTDPVTGRLLVGVADTPGLAPPPDPDRLTALGAVHAEVPLG